MILNIFTNNTAWLDENGKQKKKYLITLKDQKFFAFAEFILPGKIE